MGAPTIKIGDASLKYENHILFKQLSITLSGGEWTCLLGPSGIGKSSLLRLIGGLKTEAILSNPIVISDELPLHGRIAYLAQNETLLPWLSALENVLIGQKLRGQKCTRLLVESAREFLAKVGLHRYLNYLPHELSGGMKQRVLLARTLFENKPVILMDEPFAALDVITRTAIQELAFELLASKTVLLVTHDPLEAMRLGHHIYVMSGKPAQMKRINLEGKPLRQLTDSHLLATHAQILDQLSHEEEIASC